VALPRETLASLHTGDSKRGRDRDWVEESERERGRKEGKKKRSAP
jgi:hypothetical protein